jgi:hypothetical protein
MITRRLLFAVFAFALVLSQSGCHHKCCGTTSSSYAPSPCCPRGTLPANYLPHTVSNP